MFHAARYSLLKLCYLVGAVLVCGMSYPILHETPLSYLGAGLSAALFLIHGAVTLLTVEFGLGGQGFLIRIASFLGWWLAGAGIWVAVFLFWEPPSRNEHDYVYLLVTALLWPAFAITSQSLLWGLRYLLGLRLIEFEGEHRACISERWTIGDLAIGTALVAVAAAGVRAAMSDFAIQTTTAAELGIVLFGILVHSATVIFPATLYALQPWRGSIAGTYLGLHCLVLTGTAAGLAIAADGWRFDEEAAVAAFLVVSCVLGPVSGCLVLRWSGYRLVGKSETQQSAKPSTPSTPQL